MNELLFSQVMGYGQFVENGYLRFSQVNKIPDVAAKVFVHGLRRLIYTGVEEEAELFVTLDF